MVISGYDSISATNSSGSPQGTILFSIVTTCKKAFYFRITSKRVDDFERIQGVKGLRIRVKCFMNYRDLKVWQKSYGLCLDLYRITKKFPKEERYGLTSQMRRCAVSIPSNIAEGYGRKTTADYLRSLIKSLVYKRLNKRLDP
jgi:hypothetical protein